MAEKTLKTRISHKIDTLENWEASTIGLKKGELAIATTAAKAGNGLAEPVAMIKIGEDGVKTFNDLHWNFYAKASDVYSWLKQKKNRLILQMRLVVWLIILAVRFKTQIQYIE